MSKGCFVARFLGAFALLIVAGGVTRAPTHYARLLQTVAAATGPIVNGWRLEDRGTPGAPQLWLRRGNQQLRFQFSLEKLALGLYPMLALFAATPGLRLRRAAGVVPAACAGFILLDLVVVWLYPVLVVPGALTDIAGTFLGLLAFVGGPVIFWFALTFPELRTVWRLR